MNALLMNYLESGDMLSPYTNMDFKKCDQLLIHLFAYNTTWRYGILKAVYDRRIRGHMAFFILNFLEQRQFRTKVGNVFSETHYQHEEVLQGNVLSCYLFALAIDGITADLPECVKSSLYVDDFMIYTTSSYLPSAERHLQRAINIINNWATNHGFTLSEDKTVAVNLNRKGSHAEPNLTLNGRSSERFCKILWHDI